MGAKGSKPKNSKPTEADFCWLVDNTKFTREEIDILWTRFREVSNSQVKDYRIDIHEFQTALGLTSSDFTSRIFAAFDSDTSSEIDFTEFVCGLSALSGRASLREKAEFCFLVYDIDKSGEIEKQELLQILKFSLSANSAVRLPDEQLAKVIEATFAQMDTNKDGGISLDEFAQAAEKNPAILACVNLNVEDIFK